MPKNSNSGGSDSATETDVSDKGTDEGLFAGKIDYSSAAGGGSNGAVAWVVSPAGIAVLACVACLLVGATIVGMMRLS